MTNETSEQWRPIKATGGKYEVSNLGHIRHHKTKRIKASHVNVRSGYHFVTAPVPNKDGKWQDQRTINLRVHVCVAEAFLEKPSKYGRYQVMHINHDKNDNAASNLAYGTQSTNVLDSLASSDEIKTVPYNRLTIQQHREIDDLWVNGASQVQIAKQYGCTNSAISRITQRKTKKSREILGPPRRLAPNANKRKWSSRDFRGKK